MDLLLSWSGLVGRRSWFGFGDSGADGDANVGCWWWWWGKAACTTRLEFVVYLSPPSSTYPLFQGVGEYIRLNLMRACLHPSNFHSNGTPVVNLLSRVLLPLSLLTFGLSRPNTTQTWEKMATSFLPVNGLCRWVVMDSVVKVLFRDGAGICKLLGRNVSIFIGKKVPINVYILRNIWCIFDVII